MNRRNVLMGLGGIVAGGGALLGTGAFSTVSAERTVTVHTTGDANALVGLDPTSDYASVSSGTLELTLTNANIDATLNAPGVFNIVNNHTEEIALNGPWSDTMNGITVTLTPQTNTVSPDGGTTAVNLEMDTNGAAEGATFDTTITIEAST